jgi:hypothetical protein
MKEFDYKKFRWFFTYSGKLVYGGKSAEQNEDIVGMLLRSGKERIVMHTRIPGSPFAIIESEIGKITDRDKKEAAIWTASFSRAWKSGLKKTQVDVFNSKDIFKAKNMKIGTFGVKKDIERINVSLSLFSNQQKDVLKFVPELTLKLRNSKTIEIYPGKIEKDKVADKISEMLKIKKEEVLQALPTGKTTIRK